MCEFIILQKIIVFYKCNYIMEYSGYANFITNEIFPKQANKNEKILFTSVDTNDFTLDGTKIIANYDGNFSFFCESQLYNKIAQNIELNTVFEIFYYVNGVLNLNTSCSAFSIQNLSGKTNLFIPTSVRLKKGDYFEYGVRVASLNNQVNTVAMPLNDPNHIGNPSVSLHVYAIIPEKPSPEGYLGRCDIFSRFALPLIPNENKYVEMTDSTTNDFTLDGSKFICNNPGMWCFTASYQLISLNYSENAMNNEIDTWASYNGKDTNSANTSQTMCLKNEIMSLVVSGVILLNKDDYLQGGIRSSSLDGKLNMVTADIIFPSTSNTGSIYISCYKINIPYDPINKFSNGVNFLAGGTYPVKVNNPEYIIMNYMTPSLDFTIDYVNSEIVCNNPGSWLLFSTLQLYAYNDTSLGIDSEMNSWFRLNGVNIKNTNTTQSLNNKGGKSVQVNQIILKLSIGDRIQIGLQSTSLNNTLNLGIKSYTGTSGIFNPSCKLLACKVK